jgi:hypothetical protein
MVAYGTHKTMLNENGVVEAAASSAARHLLAFFDGMCDWLVDALPNGGVYANMPEILVRFVIFVRSFPSCSF